MSIQMHVSSPAPVRINAPDTGKYVTYDELAEILRDFVSTGDLETALSNYATKRDLDNETVMRWGSGGNNA